MKFLDGKEPDRAETCWVICFNLKVRTVLVTSCDKKKNNLLINCHVLKSRMSDYDDFEIVMVSSTIIKDSDLKIDLSTLPAINSLPLILHFRSLQPGD